MPCDLHIHSVYSDGSCTPTELVHASVDLGLSAIALCDHNTVDGLPEFLSAAEGKNIEAIPGSEFSVDYNGTELHLLGLYISREYFPQATVLLSETLVRKEQSNLALIESLRKAGYPLDYAAIKAKTPKGKINRAHIAAEMTRLGYVSSVKEALHTILSPAYGHYVIPKRLSIWDILDFLCSIGAVPVLAHPYLNLSRQALPEFLPQAKARGLAGLECYYSLHDRRTTCELLQLAEQFDLLPSGGSDFHGDIKPGIQLGVGTGNLAVPDHLPIALGKYRNN